MPSFPGERDTMRFCAQITHQSQIFHYIIEGFTTARFFGGLIRSVTQIICFPQIICSRHSCTSQTTAIEINEKAFSIVKTSVSRGNIFSMQVAYLLKQLPLRLMRMNTDQLAFSKCYEVLYNTVVSVTGHLDMRSLNKQLQRQDKLHREIRWRKRFFIVRFASLNGANNISQQLFTSLHFPFITRSFECRRKMAFFQQLRIGSGTLT